ncbi:MAG: hypothetical protein ACO1SV_12100 [Fimbriimonas sp.]
MKKLYSLIAVVILGITMIGCGSGDGATVAPTTNGAASGSEVRKPDTKTGNEMGGPSEAKVD